MIFQSFLQRKIISIITVAVLIMMLIPTGTTDNGGSKDAEDILWWYDLDAPSFGSAASADIDDDGYLEIVFGTYFNDEHIYALNANNGTLLWKYDTGGCNDASPVIYDVDLDGELEVIIPSSSPYEVYCFDGTTGTVEWNTSTGYPNCLDSPPAVADVDNDEKPEVILGTWYGYVFCLNGEDGSICWQINLGTDSYIQAEPNILDVDDDGQLDVVVAQYLGDCRVYCLYGNNGSTMWYSPLPTEEMYHGGSFADIDEDGKPEIVIGCYDNHVYVFNAEDGSLVWDYIAPYYIASPTSIADLNNDDHLEIVFTSYNYLGVLSYTGGLLWNYTTGGSMFRGASIADTNNDGILDVVFGADDGILRVASGDDGSLLWSIDLEDHYGDTFNIDHAPVIEDFDNDGTLDIFIIGGYGISNPDDGNHGRAYAIDAGTGTGPGWPMFRHDIYHSACFHYTTEDETTVSVDNDADPSWYDTTHVRTIQEGINNASEGSIVYVYNGTYYENVVVDKTIDLIGENKETVIIDGMSSENVINITSDYVNLTGFTLQNCTPEHGWVKYTAGIMINEHANHTTIRDNIISNNHNYGVFIYSSQNTIINNYIHNSTNHGIGIHHTIAMDNMIKNNRIENNSIGIWLGAHFPGESLNTLNTSVIGNIVKFNSKGISLDASGNNITENNVEQNEVGMSIYEGSEYNGNPNCIYHNNFVNNSDNVRCYWSFYYTFGSIILDDGYPSGGNYYDDYPGIDSNGDGIGDSPYQFNGNVTILYDDFFDSPHIFFQRDIIDGDSSGVTWDFNDTLPYWIVEPVGSVEGDMLLINDEAAGNGNEGFDIVSYLLDTSYCSNITLEFAGTYRNALAGDYFKINTNDTTIALYDYNIGFGDIDYLNLSPVADFKKMNLSFVYYDNYSIAYGAVLDSIRITGRINDVYPLMEPWISAAIDINQSFVDRGFPIRHAADGDWAAAQSFLPTLNSISSAKIRLRKFGTPEFNLTIELREDHPQGTLIDTLIFTPEEVPSSWEWFNLDFTDTAVTPDTEYFIVCPPAPSGVTTSFGYEWGYAFGNQYDDGAFWFTRDGGGLWRDLPTMYEFTFRTYGYS